MYQGYRFGNLSSEILASFMLSVMPGFGVVGNQVISSCDGLPPRGPLRQPITMTARTGGDDDHK